MRLPAFCRRNWRPTSSRIWPRSRATEHQQLLHSFDANIHGPLRSLQAREQTRESLAEAWSLLETLGFFVQEQRYSHLFSI